MSILLEFEKAEQFIERYKHAQTEIDKIDILIAATLELRVDYPEKCLDLADEIISRSHAISYKKGLGNGYNHKGACFWLLGDYEEGLEVLETAKDIALEINDKDLEAKTLNNFGRILRELGDVANALRHFEQSMVLNEALQHHVNLSINLINISALYYDLGDYDTALEYALKTLPIFEENKDINKQVSLYHLLGNIYFKQENLKDAEFYYEKIIEIACGNPLFTVMAECGLGKVYFKQSNFLAAEEYLSLSIEKARQVNSFETEIVALFYLAKVYLAQDNIDKSLEKALECYKIADIYQRKQDLLSIHEELFQIYDKKGDVENALFHLKKYEGLKEQIFQQATLNKLRNLQVKNQIELVKKEKEVAEKTAQLKQQFMANMSHEIRTPMNAIVGLANLLINKNPTEEQLKYLNAIKKSADNLLVIINDILDLSKIEAGKVVLEQIPFNLKSHIDEIYNTLFLRAEEKNLELIFETETIADLYVTGDPTRLTQILINLLGNAIKFTEKGHVKLHVIPVAKEDKTVTVQFHVIDTGIGIAEDYVKKIFESFTQAGTDTARKYGGTGLGLTISKELTDLMQGNISVKSTLGHGTTFTVEIPFPLAAASDIRIEDKEQIDVNKLAHLKILLVEDNEFNVMVAEETLNELLPDVHIVHAENGQKALERLEQESDFDLILMDIQMPVMNGVEATEAIRKHSNTHIRHKKIIALTANAFEEDIRKYFRAGMNGYVTKPFKQDELLNEIYQVIFNDMGTPPVEEQAEVADEITDKKALPDVITNMAFLHQLTMGNEEKMTKYKSMFLVNAPKLLNDIKNGIEEDDYEKVKIAAHSLKPQLGYMGVTEEVSNIYLIEKSAAERAHQHIIKPLIDNLERVLQKCLEELS